MENRRGIPINVSVNPSEYAGRSIRLGGNNLDMREKMNQRMREFEEESRKWRDQFLSSPTLPPVGASPGLIDSHSRPRMFFNYPEFPELGSSSSSNGAGFSSPFGSSLTRSNPGAGAFGGSTFPAPLAPFAQSSHKSFMEEDDLGNKKYKIQFEIGDFKPNEIQVIYDLSLI